MRRSLIDANGISIGLSFSRFSDRTKHPSFLQRVLERPSAKERSILRICSIFESYNLDACLENDCVRERFLVQRFRRLGILEPQSFRLIACYFRKHPSFLQRVLERPSAKERSILRICSIFESYNLDACLENDCVRERFL